MYFPKRALEVVNSTKTWLLQMLTHIILLLCRHLHTINEQIRMRTQRWWGQPQARGFGMRIQ